MTASIAPPVHTVVLYNESCFPREQPPVSAVPNANWCDHRPLRMTERCPVFREPIPLPTPSKEQ
jgi:hypothetical protein